MNYSVLLGAGQQLFGGLLGAGAEDKRSIAQNKAIQQYNQQLMLQQAKNVGQINAQRTLSRERTAATLFNVTQVSTAREAQVQQAAAASDTIGSSVQEAVKTINVAADRESGSAVRSQEQAELGFDLMLEQSIDQTRYNFHKEDISQGRDMLLGAVGGAIGTVGIAYGMDKLLPQAEKKQAAPTDVKSKTNVDWWTHTKAAFGYDSKTKQWNTW
ncbi:internal virion protein A [Providencia phage vB_PstP_PS3]|uniref:Internal virion protein A n=1 Tax=Providencia phage vB_PstP_PS3 TaxID=2848038 RepID=A0A411AWF2_9CAUD|nr:internal virion protein [Providencia phage vB_PstP_PS3]QAX92400.1 internal virion protein A [Providencia phage vB_PstP_PS3]